MDFFYNTNKTKPLSDSLDHPYLIGQIVEMDNVTHHPNRLVEGTEFVISITVTQKVAT